VSYSVLFAGDRARIDDFKSWLLLNKKPAERLRDIRDASPQIKKRDGARGTLFEPGEPRKRAVVRDRGRDVRAPLRTSAP